MNSAMQRLVNIIKEESNLNATVRWGGRIVVHHDRCRHRWPSIRRGTWCPTLTKAQVIGRWARMRSAFTDGRVSSTHIIGIIITSKDLVDWAWVKSFKGFLVEWNPTYLPTSFIFVRFAKWICIYIGRVENVVKIGVLLFSLKFLSLLFPFRFFTLFFVELEFIFVFVAHPSFVTRGTIIFTFRLRSEASRPEYAHPFAPRRPWDGNGRGPVRTICSSSWCGRGIDGVGVQVPACISPLSP